MPSFIVRIVDMQGCRATASPFMDAERITGSGEECWSHPKILAPGSKAKLRNPSSRVPVNSLHSARMRQMRDIRTLQQLDAHERHQPPLLRRSFVKTARDRLPRPAVESASRRAKSNLNSVAST